MRAGFGSSPPQSSSLGLCSWLYLRF